MLKGAVIRDALDGKTTQHVANRTPSLLFISMRSLLEHQVCVHLR
jgi:hypothetical protein